MAELQLPRIGYDDDESIYFDRTKPIVVDGESFFEECDPERVCAEMQEVIARLRLAVRVACALLPNKSEAFRGLRKALEPKP